MKYNVGQYFKYLDLLRDIWWIYRVSAVESYRDKHYYSCMTIEPFYADTCFLEVALVDRLCVPCDMLGNDLQ